LSFKPTASDEAEDEKTIMDRMVQGQLDKWRKLLDKVLKQGVKIENFQGGPIITTFERTGKPEEAKLQEGFLKR
jgi:hypothetical protein